MSQWHLYVNALGTVLPRLGRVGFAHPGEEALELSIDQRYRIHGLEEELLLTTIDVDGAVRAVESVLRQSPMLHASWDGIGPDQLIKEVCELLAQASSSVTLWLNADSKLRDALSGAAARHGLHPSWLPSRGGVVVNRKLEFDGVLEELIGDARAKDRKPVWIDFDTRRTTAAFERGVDAIAYLNLSRLEDELRFRKLLPSE